jgi:hypothetical protein
MFLKAKLSNYILKQLFNRIFKIFTFIIFTQQSILLLIDYLKYQTVIDLKIVLQDYYYNPAIIFCMK